MIISASYLFDNEAYLLTPLKTLFRLIGNLPSRNKIIASTYAHIYIVLDSADYCIDPVVDCVSCPTEIDATFV